MKKRTVRLYRLCQILGVLSLVSFAAALTALWFERVKLSTEWLSLCIVLMLAWIVLVPKGKDWDNIICWLNLGLSLRDLPTNQTERDQYATTADSFLSHLFGDARRASVECERLEALLFTAERNAEYARDTKAAKKVRELRKTLGTARQNERKAKNDFWVAWDLFTKSPFNGGLEIVSGPRYTDPDNLRHSLPAKRRVQ